MQDWDDAFANLAYISDGELLLGQIANDARAFRLNAHADFDVPYSDGARNKFDFFHPSQGSPKGLMIFVHGGYWMQTSKADWSHLARAAVERGYAACLPGYTLAPAARISQITLEVGQAIQTAAKIVEGPIYLCGHSAGGHLAARMICNDSPLNTNVLARIESVAPISGVFDLRPLMHTEMNQTLRLDYLEAATESPALLSPDYKGLLTIWVGSDERPEFIRQSRLLSSAWADADINIRLTEEKNAHHFTVLEGLKDPSSPLVEAIFAD